MLNIALAAPIPNPAASIAETVIAGLRNAMRQANRTFCASFTMHYTYTRRGRRKIRALATHRAWTPLPKSALVSVNPRPAHFH